MLKEETMEGVGVFKEVNMGHLSLNHASLPLASGLC
jgi:hypothetical protein